MDWSALCGTAGAGARRPRGPLPGGQAFPPPARAGRIVIHGDPRIGRRRAVQAAFAVAAALALLLWWLLPAGGPSYPRDPVSFSTGVRNGVYDTYGKLLRKDLDSDLPGVRVDLLRSQGSVDNVRRVATGRADFAIAAADAVADYHGAGAKRLRACARLYDDYMQLVVPRGRRSTRWRICAASGWG